MSLPYGSTGPNDGATLVATLSTLEDAVKRHFPKGWNATIQFNPAGVDAIDFGPSKFC